MSVSEIAQSLVDLCKAYQFDEAYTTLFAADAKSVEGNGDTAVGLEALLAKSEGFAKEYEFKEFTVTNPYVGKDSFAVIFKAEMAPRAGGKSIVMEEVALYFVADGKITEERFLYGS